MWIEEERHRKLVELALRVLEEATIRGDNRAMLFILAQTCRGRIAAEVVPRQSLGSRRQDCLGRTHARRGIPSIGRKAQ